MELSKRYDPKEAEVRLQKFWEKNKIYAFDSKSKKKTYSIDTPPPTVSGKMHIGHSFSYSQQDFIARFHRMKNNVFYPFGTDNNGLPTEKLIEKIKKVKSKSMSREDFIKLCNNALKEITPDFIEDWKKLGISCDYDIYYSTINDNSRRLSQKYFLDLYKKGLIYIKDFPTLWDTRFQTPVAQAELEDKEKDSLFSTLKFKVGSKNLPIATTRPELLGACGAVFVNPNDKRYKTLVGKKAKVPLFNQEVPIIEDESAEIDKGTGILMVCSYGDKYDVDAFNRHKLKPNIVITKDGKLNIGKYTGMTIEEGRKKILEELDKAGLIIEQKPIKHTVNVFEKSGKEIEFLPAEQYFIKILDKKKKLIAQGKKIDWNPKFMFKRYKNWVEGLDWDWIISRERHFGVSIPLWKCECGEIILANEKELPINPIEVKKKCSKCGKIAKGEEKVLDTWATSSLTPQIASDLIDEKIKIPFSLRPQAHDIIRTWAFYTIVRSLYHEDKIPWENIMISGFVTLKGEKMSKSKGNVIAPQEVMNKYCADALRFWAAGSKLGEDLDYQEKDLVTGQKFVNKLWNASKFSLMHLKDYKKSSSKVTEVFDKWLLSKLNKLIEESTESFEKYEYSKTKSEVENFFWHTFCDYYLEISKDRLYNPDKRGIASKKSGQKVVYTTILSILKMMAPIMPHITEEIY
ncbi:valine--tRNA ligase, partial [Nanoarchaeota archaeon]